MTELTPEERALAEAHADDEIERLFDQAEAAELAGLREEKQVQK